MLRFKSTILLKLMKLIWEKEVKEVIVNEDRKRGKKEKLFLIIKIYGRALGGKDHYSLE